MDDVNTELRNQSSKHGGKTFGRFLLFFASYRSYSVSVALPLSPRWQEQSLYFLALDCFTRYMEAPQSREFVYTLQQREVNGEQLPIRTVSAGLVRLKINLLRKARTATDPFVLHSRKVFPRYRHSRCTFITCTSIWNANDIRFETTPFFKALRKVIAQCQPQKAKPCCSPRTRIPLRTGWTCSKSCQRPYGSEWWSATCLYRDAPWRTSTRASPPKLVCMIKHAHPTIYLSVSTGHCRFRRLPTCRTYPYVRGANCNDFL